MPVGVRKSDYRDICFTAGENVVREVVSEINSNPAR
jgi:hypothetical protein